MSDDRNRRERELILARRRFFVASALAGVGVMGGCDHARPCLNVAEPPRSEAGAEPTSDETPPSETDAGTAEDPSDAGEPPTEPPEVCLSVPEPKAQPKSSPKSPPPHVCLEFAEPPGKD